jgi:copper chaperone NosL
MDEDLQRRNFFSSVRLARFRLSDMWPKHPLISRQAAAVALFAFLFLQSAAFSGDRPPQTPSKNDKCPVCGMFVYKYPDWVAQMVFRDGTTVFFDGAKDMFKYYFGLGKGPPGRSAAEIGVLYVMDYYDIKPIDARRAFFVMGSDIYGPMGKELIPFKTQPAAEEFLRDHGGQRIIGFDEVKPALLKALD